MGKIALVILGVIILAALLIGGWAVGGYNNLTTKRNLVDQQWSQVENMLQRRADLIPNLVGTVKGVANLEESILTKIADARSKILSPTATPEEKMEASNQMTQAARQAGLLPGSGGILGPGGRFLSITEAYPQLKSDQSFLRLQDELAGTENRLAVARRDYNNAATDYNTTRQKFPTVLIAGFLNFQDKPLFKADEGARQAPKVDFSK
ncbi:MAG: LemA family protein [Acidobacteria bacterium]|nr:LemA family protein [Acidobacteriota bacterium]